MECSICLEEIPENLHMIQCCDKKMCLKCGEFYLLQLTKPAECPFCKKVWDILFLSNTFSTAFVKNQYRQIQENYLLERERLRLPEYKLEVDFENAYKELKELEKSPFSHSFQMICFKYRIPNTDQNLEYYRKNVTILEQSKMMLQYRINQLQKNLNKTTPTEIINCLNEKCKGVIEKETFKCVVCNTLFCRHCLEQKTEHHECKKETVENIKAIKKNTRPCPKCNIPIEKDGGCDQMYCVYCDVSFFWSTGKINQGKIHNPEYFRKMRDLKIEIKNDCNQECQNLNDLIREIDNCIAGYASNNYMDTDALNLIEELITYGTHYIDDQKLRKNGMKFVKGLLTEDEWKKLIYCSYKGSEYHLGCRKIGTMYREMLVHAYLDHKIRDDIVCFLEAYDYIQKQIVKDLEKWSSFCGRKYIGHWGLEMIKKYNQIPMHILTHTKDLLTVSFDDKTLYELKTYQAREYLDFIITLKECVKLDVNNLKIMTHSLVLCSQLNYKKGQTLNNLGKLFEEMRILLKEFKKVEIKLLTQ